MTASEPAAEATADEQPSGRAVDDELSGPKSRSGREAGDPPADWTLADRINHLFETVPRPDGKPSG